MISRLVVANLCLGLGLASQAQGQVSPEAAELLRKAADAAGRLKSIGYAAKCFSEGDGQSHGLKLEGTVIAVRGLDDARQKVSIMGTTLKLGKNQPTSFVYASDGETAYWLDHDSKSFSRAPQRDTQFVERILLLPAHYLSASAYDRELRAARATVEPSQVVGQTACHVVDVQYDAERVQSAKYFFGKSDMIVRRIEQTSKPMGAGLTMKLVFTVSSIQINTSIADEVFTPKMPNGYQEQPMPSANVRTFPTRLSANASGPAAAGGNGKPAAKTPAPDWSMKSMDGKQVRLADLRGRVVLLDFWATWCGPCRMAMPGVQKLYDRFKDKPVSIFGVNCRERGGTEGAVKYIKDKGFTYPQLLDPGDVSNKYGVRGIPTFVLIGPDGHILFQASGYSPQIEAQIESLIAQTIAP